MRQVITEIMLLPDGLDENVEDIYDDARHFAVFVRWAGRRQGNAGGFMVTQSFRDCQLSRAGNWAYCVPKFKRHQYRWETLDEALAMARAAVNGVVVNGRTYSQWQAFRAAATN
jgi:hypothetical protein